MNRDKEIAIAQGTGKAKRSSGKAVHGLTHTDVLAEFHRLESEDAKAAFARTWLAKSSEALKETWGIFYQLLELVEKRELYKKQSSLGEAKLYDSFKDYFEKEIKPSFSELQKQENSYQYLSRHFPELLDSKDELWECECGQINSQLADICCDCGSEPQEIFFVQLSLE